MENNTSTKHENGNDTNRLLYTVLEKYVRYVMEAEGTDFITIHDNRYMCDVKFTDEEWEILGDISKKVNYPLVEK